VDAGFRGSLGLSLEELSERWQKEMKVIYWPDIARREEPADYSKALTDTRKDGSFYNTSPAISRRGTGSRSSPTETSFSTSSS